VIPVVPVSTTTNVTSTIIDGALRNALVCVDKNSNGVCDAGETQGRTDAAGNVTLAVPNADVGLYPTVAAVGTDAVDADSGPVLTAYALTSPAGKAAVVSPLTTLVHQHMQDTGSAADVSERLLQTQTGVTSSLFADFTTPAAKAAAATSTSPNAATVARMVVVAAQAQNTPAIAAKVGTAPVGSTALITQADLNKVIVQKILEMLPSILAIVTDPANTTPTAVEAALKTALAPGGSLAGSVLTPPEVPIRVGIIKAPVVATAPPVGGFNVGFLVYTSPGNWNTRVFSASNAQATPVNNKTIFIDRRAQSVSSAVANWNYGGNPQSQANLHWTGTAWENCGLNFESTSTLPNANGIRTTNYCNNYAISTNTRIEVDVSGQVMADVYNATVTDGYTDMNISPAGLALLGGATFPSGSVLRYQNTTDLARAFVYGPGTNSVVTKNVTATGTLADCAISAPNTGVTTLEELVATFRGTPCTFAGIETIASAAPTTGDTVNTRWGSTTLGLMTVGSVALSTTPATFYTGNTYIRMAFTAGAPNEVTYYACKQQAVNGSVRSCVATGAKGAYSIQTLADNSRVMTLTNMPSQTAPLTSNRIFVQSVGVVYAGFVDKLATTKAARLTKTAANALFTALVMPPVDEELPLKLTATSYQGVWEATDPAGPAGNGDTITLNSDGSASCKITATGVAYTPCGLTITNAATGAFSFHGSNPIDPTGTADFLTGVGTGTFDNAGTPTQFTIKRR
jgi:trimeric autotransporter adhesin